MSDMASIHFLIEEKDTFAAVGRFYREREIIAFRRLAWIVRAMGRRPRMFAACGYHILGCLMRRFGDANFGYIWGFVTRFVSRDIYYYYFARLPLLSIDASSQPAHPSLHIRPSVRSMSRRPSSWLRETSSPSASARAAPPWPSPRPTRRAAG